MHLSTSSRNSQGVGLSFFVLFSVVGSLFRGQLYKAEGVRSVVYIIRHSLPKPDNFSWPHFIIIDRGGRLMLSEYKHANKDMLPNESGNISNNNIS